MIDRPDAVTWRRCDDVLWRRSLETVLVLPPGADDPAMLPGTAAAVWDLLAEPMTLDELVSALSEVYEGDTAAITADVTDLLEQLQTLGAVRSGVT